MLYRRAAKIVIILALVGLADATYLTVEHYLGGLVPCSTFGCETVLRSPYSVVYGVPLALWGGLYYLALILLAGLYLSTETHRFLGLAFALVTGGVLTSAILTYLQGVVLEAWCIYCLTSAASTFLIFLTLIFSKPAER